MSEVEELRAAVIARCYAIDPEEPVDALIAAVRAEGAEQERERIRKESLHYAEGEPLEGTDAESVEGDEAIAQQEMFIIPASVLAPAPKELT